MVCHFSQKPHKKKISKSFSACETYFPEKYEILTRHETHLVPSVWYALTEQERQHSLVYSILLYIHTSLVKQKESIEFWSLGNGTANNNKILV